MTFFCFRSRSTDGSQVFGFFLLALLAGCVSISKPAGFLEDYSRLYEGAYFKQEYVAPGVNFFHYSKVKVEPVSLRYFKDPSKFEPEDLERLAARLRTELENGLSQKYEAIEPPGKADKETLVVTPVLVDVETPPRTLNVVTSALVFVPVASGSATFEAKLSDGETGKVLAEIAEKRSGNLDAASLTVGPYMKFVHAEAAFKKWGDQLKSFVARSGRG